MKNIILKYSLLILISTNMMSNSFSDITFKDDFNQYFNIDEKISNEKISNEKISNEKTSNKLDQSNSIETNNTDNDSLYNNIKEKFNNMFSTNSESQLENKETIVIDEEFENIIDPNSVSNSNTVSSKYGEMKDGFYISKEELNDEKNIDIDKKWKDETKKENNENNKQYVSEKVGILSALENLIQNRKYESALDIFNELMVDISENQYFELKNFLEIIISLNDEIEFKGIEHLTNERTLVLFDEFFLLLEEGKLKDTDYIAKGLTMVDISNLSQDNKSRIKMKLFYLSGRYVYSIQYGLNIMNKTKEDSDFVTNLFNIMEVIEHQHFENMNTNYKEWSLKNLNKNRI